MNSQDTEQQHTVPAVSSHAAAKKQTGFGVAPSPFNGVKLELGLLLVAGVVIWLAAESIIASVDGQLLLLAGYGVAAALWLTFRTRRVLRRCAEEAAARGPDDIHRPGQSSS